MSEATTDIGSGKGKAGILFTAFEPSGDNLAAPVIAELKRMVPQLNIYACGGPQMEQAGATIIERTADSAAMGLNSVRKARQVRRQIKSIQRWAKEYRVLAHVPVDSPAANFPICRIMRSGGARVVHLVAPQIWAWGGGRIRKLRKLTDLVLCLLPFEEQWFNDRQVPARFIGHPRINRALDQEKLKDQMRGLPQSAPKIGIFPGSRAHEVTANIRLLSSAYHELQGRYGGMCGVIVAATPEMAQLVRKKLKQFPTNLHMVTGQSEAVIGWCDIAIAVSGTITLDLARQRKPMIGVYKTGLIQYLLSKVLLRTKFRLLPNIIADREIVPEFVPHAGGSGPIVREATHLLHDSKNQATQSAELNRVVMRFANKRPDIEAAKYIVNVIKTGRPE